MLKLTIEDDEGKTTVIPIVRDEMTIGRQDGNTIRLTERNVSRRHARLLQQNGVVYIEDLASFTGVKLNGARITAVMPIRDGDQMQIGDYKVVLRADRPVDTPALNSTNAVRDSSTPNNLKASRAPTPAMGSRGGTPSGMAAAAVATATATASLATAAATAIAARDVATAPAPEDQPTPAPMEGQPTIPVRTLGTVVAPGRVAAPAPARLVVQTSELAGVEFMLDRASVVIGRTDENDLQLNHRSISRHHAKVVRDGDRYTIVDLQSANGVRVNGEDYERIELNPGDMIELGHVKLRFVGPFELYVFDPLAAKRSERRIPSKVVFTMAGVVLAALALVAVRKIAGGSKSAEENPAVAAQTAPAAAAPQPAAAAPATPPPAAPGVEPVSPQNEVDRRAAVAFAKFDEASTAKNYGSALDWFDAIPEESTYKQRARPRFEEARTLFVAEHLMAAEKARSQGKCAEANQEADEVTRVDPSNRLVKEVIKLCRPRGDSASVVAATTAPRAGRPKGGPSGGAAPGRDAARAEAAAARASRSEGAQAHAAAPAEPPGDPDALMKQAREAWLHQQCGSAIDSARKALRAKPGLSDAYQIIAVCSCSLRDVDGANRAYSKLDDRSRSLARSLCQKNGIALGGDGE